MGSVLLGIILMGGGEEKKDGNFKCDPLLWFADSDSDGFGVVMASDNEMARFDFNGHIDTSLASSGYVNLNYTLGGSGSNPLILDQNGNFYAIVNNNNTAIEVARYLPLGHLDTTFGNSGTASWTEAFSQIHGRTLAQHQDGDILVSGLANDLDDDFIIVKFCQLLLPEPVSQTTSFLIHDFRHCPNKKRLPFLFDL